MGLFSFLGKEYRQLRRYNHILRVLTRYGFEELVSHIDERKSIRFLRKLIPRSMYARAVSLSKWEKMRLVCEELGPTFVKFGQILSNRPDLLPHELILELEKLQDGVPPVPGDVARQVIEQQLGKPITELFASFDERAFASASIAQVHRATLLTGQEVVIKVQRPGIREIIGQDIQAMLHVAAILHRRVPSVRHFDPVGLIRVFEESIQKELDFLHESISLQRFRNNFKEDKTDEGYVSAPLVYAELCTDRVLTLEFIRGIKISDIRQLEAGGFDRKVIARRLLNAYFKQVFEYGYFHADPHPGNIFVLPGNTLCFIDFGMMGSIMRRDLEQLGYLFMSVRAREPRRIIRALQQLSDNPVIRNFRALESDLNEFVHNYYVREMQQNELSTLLLELKDIIIRHGLKVPAHFFLLARSLVSVEGVCRLLDPELDVTDTVKPYLVRVIRRRYDPLKFAGRVLGSIYELGMYMEDFPRDLKTAIRKINSGEINVDIQHKGIDPVVHTMIRFSKLIIGAVIASALVVGGSLLMVANTAPYWRGMSAPAVGAFVLAGFVLLGMLNNLRKGDYDNREQ